VGRYFLSFGEVLFLFIVSQPHCFFFRRSSSSATFRAVSAGGEECSASGCAFILVRHNAKLSFYFFFTQISFSRFHTPCCCSSPTSIFPPPPFCSVETRQKAAHISPARGLLELVTAAQKEEGGIWKRILPLTQTLHPPSSA